MLIDRILVAANKHIIGPETICKMFQLFLHSIAVKTAVPVKYWGPQSNSIHKLLDQTDIKNNYWYEVPSFTFQGNVQYADGKRISILHVS